MNQLVHDAQTERPLGAFDLAREDDVERRAGANQPGEPLAAARPRENAELHFREAELGPGVIGGHAVPAGEGELEPAAEARAVNPGGDRFGEARHPAQHFLALGRKPLGFRGGGEPDELLDVGPRDEVLGFPREERSEEHTSELQSHGLISYAVFCLKKKKKKLIKKPYSSQISLNNANVDLLN